MDKSVPQYILERSDVVKHLKNTIRDYSDRIHGIEERRAQYIQDKEYKGLGSLSDYFHEKVFDTMMEGKDLPFLRRALSSMRFELKMSQGGFNSDDNWQISYRRATEDIRIEDVVVRFLNISPEKLGCNISCPFHEDKKPSLRIYTNKNRFVCFSCGASGMPIDFIIKLKECDFKTAVNILSSL